MVSRRTILGLSIVLSVALHGLLLLVAPHVPLLSMRPGAKDVPKLFQVQLRAPQEDPIWDQQSEEQSDLATRPGKVEDMLDRKDEPLEFDESVLKEQVELSDLPDRLASETIEREHDLAQDAGAMTKVDAKIIEIEQEDARRDIEVARRYVRPSPERILGPDEFPTLRTDTGDDRALEAILSAPPVGSSLGQPIEAPSGEAAAAADTVLERPRYEEDVLEPAILEPGLPPMPIEETVSKAPVVQEVREESNYEFIDDLVDIRLDAYVPKDEAKGYFRLQIVPKDDGKIEVLPKDVTFVIDASNSILERKLKSTVKGVESAIGALKPEDCFNVVIFRDTATDFRPVSVPATPENKTAVREFLKDLKPRGQTDVYQGIKPVIDRLPREGVPGIVMVMTDGRPTTGVRDGRTIINALTAENKQQNTIFAFSGGNTVNEYLLDLLAYRNKGESCVVPGIDNMDQDLSKFFGKLNDPILVDLKADYGRVDGEEIFPKEVPDFYRGRAVTVYGRFDPKSDKEFSMRLTGLAKDREKELVFKSNLSKAATGDKNIARNWAFQRVYYLIGEICRVGETPELIGELRELSRKYSIKTSYD